MAATAWLTLALLAMVSTTASGCNDRQRARAAPPHEEGIELLGEAAPDWSIPEWIGSAPSTLASLRGKLVFVRWFTAPHCPHCSTSAAALNQLHRDYAARGLAVIGMYHHKSKEPLRASDVAGWRRQYGFEFPVAIDRDWLVLRQWWLAGQRRKFTSVSFLLDRDGIIRFIHPGGTLGKDSPEFKLLRHTLDALLIDD